jgi:hypothetical protein
LRSTICPPFGKPQFDPARHLIISVSERKKKKERKKERKKREGSGSLIKVRHPFAISGRFFLERDRDKTFSVGRDLPENGKDK